MVLRVVVAASLLAGISASLSVNSIDSISQTVGGAVDRGLDATYGESPLTYPVRECKAPGYPVGQNTAVEIEPDASKRRRTYHIYVPASYNSSVAVPVVLNFAGLNAPCLDIFNVLKPAADARGHVLVTLCGSNGLIGTAWNSGTCCYFKKTKVDDYAFTTQVLADVKDKLCIDDARVWAAGFSNGAMMVETLACKMADQFRAVASVSGVVEISPGNEGGLEKCDNAVLRSNARASVLNVHGTADHLVPFAGDLVLGFPAVQKNMYRWAARNGCSPNATSTFHVGQFDNAIYSGCITSGSVELVRHHEAHTWPVTKDFDTTAYVQNFFDRVSK